MARKLNIVIDQSSANYDARNEIIFETEVSKSNLGDYNDTYILVTDDIAIIGLNTATKLTFKNCVPFLKFITKIEGKIVDNAEDLDLVMPMLNLLEYSLDYFDTTLNLEYFESITFNANIAYNNNNFRCFNYNAKLL